MNKYIKRVFYDIKKRNKGEKEFIQAVEEVLFSLQPYIEKHPE